MADTRTCARPGCPRPATVRIWCESDYRRQIRMGRVGYRDAGPAREHVRRLRQLGWTYKQIAEAAGVSTWVPHKLNTQATRWVWSDRADAVMAVPLVPRTSHRGVDGTGTYRRLEALQWLGWPAATIAARLGLKPYTLTTLRWRREPVSFRVARAMAELYDELSHLPGPSKMTATKARRRGYAPPLAWDDDTIDDPQAQPAGVGHRPASRQEAYLDARRIGYQPWEAAAKAGVARSTARKLEQQLVSADA